MKFKEGDRVIIRLGESWGRIGTIYQCWPHYYNGDKCPRYNISLDKGPSTMRYENEIELSVLDELAKL